MIVKAKCIVKAWDSGAGVLCYPGEIYEIENTGKLAQLKTPMGEYVFEFDRNTTRTLEGIDVRKDYSCKELGCVDFGKDFKTLAALGRHANMKHRELSLMRDDEPVQERPDGRKKKRVFPCKHCTEVLPNLYAYKLHLKSHAETAVPA